MSNALGVVQKFFPQVKRVVDATTNASIEVTGADTKNSAVKNHSACAMAVACKRKFKLDGVIISRKVAYLIKGTKARRFYVPESVSREVVSFDRGSGFAPGEYELSKVPTGAQLGRQKTQTIKNRTVKEPRKRHITTNVRTVLGGQKPRIDK